MQSEQVLSYLLKLDYRVALERCLTTEELSLLDRVKRVCDTKPICLKILGLLLSRKWPKYHQINLEPKEDAVAFQILTDFCMIETLESSVDWLTPCLERVRLKWRDSLVGHLLVDLPRDEPGSRLDVLLDSLNLPELYDIHGKSTVTKSSVIEYIKKAYNGRQRTIFGAVNDTVKLLKQVSRVCEVEACSGRGTCRLVLLSSNVRDLFLRITFMLDIDADEEAWNNALPVSLLRGAVLPLSDWRFLNANQQDMQHLHIYVDRDHVELDRAIDYLCWCVENKRRSAHAVSNNVKRILENQLVLIHWNRQLVPEWIWRRREARRLSNLLWKCIFELERLKEFEVAVDLLKFLTENHYSLLGRKRKGKVAVRLLIGLGHLCADAGDVSMWTQKILSISDLFPADRAEIERRSMNVSITQFEWPCESVFQREVIIPGCKSRSANWVEQVAIESFYTLGVESGGFGFSNGIHCEGRIMMQLFGVVLHAFLSAATQNFSFPLWQSPLQRWALDVGFLTQSSDRWSEVELALAEIEVLEFDQLANHYMRLVGGSRFPISMGAIEGDITTDAIDCIPSILSCMRGTMLASILRQIASDPYYWSGGQPDLIVWHTSPDPRLRKIIFSEVKGPGDQLSPRQRFWLAALKSAGAQTEVCWVKEEKPPVIAKKRDVKKVTKRKQKRNKLEAKQDVEADLVEIEDDAVVPLVNFNSKVAFSNTLDVIEISDSSSEEEIQIIVSNYNSYA